MPYKPDYAKRLKKVEQYYKKHGEDNTGLELTEEELSAIMDIKPDELEKYFDNVNFEPMTDAEFSKYDVPPNAPYLDVNTDNFFEKLYK